MNLDGRGSALLHRELRPHRRVIGWFFPDAHFAVDAGCGTVFNHIFACQHGINPQAAISFKTAHLIVPPGEELAFLMMDSKCVVLAKAAQLPEGCSFAFRSHNRPPPEIDIVNIHVLRRDIKIAAHEQVVRFFFRHAVSQPAVPL